MYCQARPETLSKSTPYYLMIILTHFLSLIVWYKTLVSSHFSDSNYFVIIPQNELDSSDPQSCFAVKNNHENFTSSEFGSFSQSVSKSAGNHLNCSLFSSSLKSESPMLLNSSLSCCELLKENDKDKRIKICRVLTILIIRSISKRSGVQTKW